MTAKVFATEAVHSLPTSLLPDFEHLNRIHVLERFPLNRNGKPDKRQLEQLALDLAPRAKA